jgi:hypothetical protein
MTRFRHPVPGPRRPRSSRLLLARVLTAGTVAAAVLVLPAALARPATTGWAATMSGPASAPLTAATAAAGPFCVPRTHPGST